MADDFDLDDLFNEIEKEEKAVATTQPKDLTTVNFGGTDISVEDDDAMMAAVFSSALSDKRQADELYRVMEDRLNIDRDRSPEAKVVLSEAVGHRINATSNLIKLLDMKKKYSAKNAGGNSLVSFQLSPRESGINIKNLTNEILNEQT